MKIRKDEQEQKQVAQQQQQKQHQRQRHHQDLVKQEEFIKEEGSDTEALSDILPISSELLDNDLVNTIMNDPDDDLTRASQALGELEENPATKPGDELGDILNPHLDMESMIRDTGLPNMDSKDVEDIFKGVLTDESQESQESSVFQQQVATSHMTNAPVAPPQMVQQVPIPGSSWFS